MNKLNILFFCLIMPRPYSIHKRAAQQAQTRRRIVDATFALHAERGIRGTKPADIAARADVALTTFYKHFPTIDDLVRACGAHGREQTPPPDPATLAALPRDPSVRIAATVRALFEYYQAREPWLYTGRTEERHFRDVQLGMAHLREVRDGFVRAALAPARAARETVGVAMALVDFWAWRTLRREVGLTQEEVIRSVAETVGRAAGAHRPGRRPPAVSKR